MTDQWNLGVVQLAEEPERAELIRLREEVKVLTKLAADRQASLEYHIRNDERHTSQIQYWKDECEKLKSVMDGTGRRDAYLVMVDKFRKAQAEAERYKAGLKLIANGYDDGVGAVYWTGIQTAKIALKVLNNEPDWDRP